MIDPNQVVIISHAAKILGVPLATISGWDRDGLINRTIVPIMPPRGMVRFKRMFRIGDVQIAMNTARNFESLSAPEGYMEFKDAAPLMNLAEATLRTRTRMGTFGSIELKLGKRTKRYILAADVEKVVAADKEAKRVEYERHLHPHPLIASEDNLCIAARREMFERSGRVLNLKKVLARSKRAM